MTTSELIRARSLEITKTDLVVELEDGSVHSAPLALFPILAEATVEERAEWEWSGDRAGIHWPQLDEDVSVFSIVHPERTQSIRPDRLAQLLEENRRRRFGTVHGLEGHEKP